MSFSVEKIWTISLLTYQLQDQYDVKPESLHLNWYDARRPRDTDPSLEAWSKIQELHWDIVAADVVRIRNIKHSAPN